jgi:bifunctional UDP-N-acetylglucosamine pyrophosphorylase/glucosamine-1-phosphate N-acetyltransferase
MDLQPRCREKVARLVDKGVTVPNPLSLDIGDEVDIDRIAGDGVVIYPGCRIYGAKTAISAGVRLGADGAVTIDDCALGRQVELRGGCFRRSVFLDKSGMGPGAQVREGCLVEEDAGGAHCVGLKQTILFPFVTLGSLANFCDCLMAGGTSRKDHSEVGSSYVHFNYTPDGDKATASLFGDVARGVMLDQPPIFLGGQGGAVGPVRVGFGTVVAAGSVLREDVTEDGLLVLAAPARGLRRAYRAYAYRNLDQVVRNNVLYLANLWALEAWYRWVRHAFFARQEMGELIYEAALEVLAQARSERASRLQEMAGKVPDGEAAGREFRERVGDVCAVFGREAPAPNNEGEAFLAGLQAAGAGGAGDYVQTIQGLGGELSGRGTRWLQEIVDGACAEVAGILTEMDLSDRRTQGSKP